MTRMNRRQPTILTGMLVLACTIACSDSDDATQVAADGPNIILVSIDSLRPDHLGCYGYPHPTSPTIDRLAADGVRFETAISTTSWTLPAHAAMFTGLFDSTHGLVDNGLRLKDQHTTLAEALAQAGYRTAGFFGGPYLHPAFGLAQGFETYQSCMTQIPDELPDEALRNESRARMGASHADVTGPRTEQEVERWLQATDDDDRPFFLFLHLWDVHYDFIAPQEYVLMFDPDYEGDLDGVGFMQNPRIVRGMDRRDRKHLLALYDAEIRFTDDSLGRILDGLEARGELEDTLVVITADHGEEFLDHGGKGHQHTLYDELIRVPMIFSWPGRFEPAVVEDQVRTVDIMPTLLSVAGLRRQPKMQGRSLLPLLTGGSLEPADAFSELLVDGRSFRALRTLEWKWVDPGEGLPAAFDLTEDPNERRPIMAEESVRIGKVRLRNLARTCLEFRSEVGGVEEIELDEEMLKRLGDLGYLDLDSDTEGE